MERLSEPTEAEGFSAFVTSLDCALYCRHCFQEKKSLFKTMAGKRLANTAIPFSHLSLCLTVGARRNWSAKIRLLWSDRTTYLICIWTLNLFNQGLPDVFSSHLNMNRMKDQWKAILGENSETITVDKQDDSGGFDGNAKQITWKPCHVSTYLLTSFYHKHLWSIQFLLLPARTCSFRDMTMEPGVTVKALGTWTQDLI